jgi:hypothetical protein
MELCKINPEAAQMVILEYLKASGHAIAVNAAWLFGIVPPVVYDPAKCQRTKLPMALGQTLRERLGGHEIHPGS